jgi:hypothetical protein
MEEKADGKGVCSKTLKFASRDLEEGNKEMILPSIFTPILGGPSSEYDKHHHKLKMYGIVFFLLQENGSQG